MATSVTEVEPYVGPLPFSRSETDRLRFFGRDREVDEVISLIYSQPVLLICAASGAGKTSLFNAAVAPALEDRGLQVLPLARVGRVPGRTLKAQRGRNLYVHNALMTIAATEEPSALGNLTLAQFLATQNRRLRHGRSSLRVLAFDQFEEFFTVYTSNPRMEQRAFVKQVAQALEVHPELRVVFLMREEYLVEVEPFARLLPPDLNAYFRLELLDPDAARQAVTGPVARTDRRFAPGVAEALVKQLRRTRTEVRPGKVSAVLGSYVEPVQLQVVCESLWSKLPPDADVITQEHLEEFGDVDEALAGLYERAIRTAVESGLVTEEQLRRWFDEVLITPMRTRGTVFSDGKAAGGIPMAVVEVLAELHIVRVEPRAKLDWYELAHDRFIEPILAANKRWEDARRNVLTAPAREWRSLGHDRGSLLRGRRLEKAAHWAKAHPEELDDLERQFLAASLEADEQERREAEDAERLRRLVEQLEAQRRISRSYELVTAANDSLRGDPERSVLLMLTALLATTDVQPATSPDVRDALHRSIQALRVRETLPHDAEVRSLAFSPDGSRLVTADVSGRVTVWDAGTPRALLTLDGAPRANAVSYSPDGRFLAVGNTGGQAIIWDASSSRELRRLPHEEFVEDLAFDPQSRRLATAGLNTVKIWDVASGQELQRLEDSTVINGVAFSPDGRSLATVGESWVARIRDAATGRRICSLVGHTGQIQCVAFSPDGRHVATGSQDVTAKVWDASSGRCVQTLTGHTGTIDAVAFSPDGSYLVTGSLDATAKVWHWSSGREQAMFGGHQHWIDAVAVSPDGTRLATASWDKTAKLWDLHHGRETVTIASAGSPATALAFNADGSRLAVGSDDGIVRLVDAASGHVVATLFGHVRTVNDIAFSPDGSLLATAASDSCSKVWEVATGRELRTLLGHAAGVNSVEFGADGRTITTASSDGTVRVWDADEGQQRRTIECGDPVSCATSSPDGRRLATGRWDGTAQVWSLEVDEPPLVLAGHEDLLSAVAFSPDGRLLATTSYDPTARAKVWDVGGGPRHGSTVLELSGHGSVVSDVAFSPAGSQLATSSWDQTVRLWDASSGERLLTLADHGSKVYCVAFSPDQRLVATAGEDGAARVHLLDTDDLVALARRRITRGLRPDECARYLRQQSGRECPPEVEALGIIATARAQATAGQIRAAAASLRKARKLHPGLRFEPEAEARGMAVAALLSEALDRVRNHDAPGAVKRFRAARKIDPTLAMDPEADTKRLVAIRLVEESQQQARDQDLSAAAEGFRKAVKLWDTLAIEPESEARRLAAVALVGKAIRLLDQREVAAAIKAYQTAERLHPGVTPGSVLNSLCWVGSVHGQASAVQGICQRAVELLPDPGVRDSRGLARALNGDYRGAIEDFAAYLEWAKPFTRLQGQVDKRRAWIARLEAGENPFNEETLADLYGE